jgi:hypothetical protein
MWTQPVEAPSTGSDDGYAATGLSFTSVEAYEGKEQS